MTLGQIGAMLVVMVIVCIIGNLWFHFVDGIFEAIKRLFRRRKPEAWHTLPKDDET